MLLEYKIKNKEQIFKIYEGVLRIIFIKISAVFIISYGILFVIINYLCEKNFDAYLVKEIFIFGGVILIVCLFINYFKYLSKQKKEINLLDKWWQIEFSEQGISEIKEGVNILYKWDGIKELKVYKEYFIIDTCLINLAKTMYFFNEFNCSKEIIKAELEKYGKVRWYYHES